MKNGGNGTAGINVLSEDNLISALVDKCRTNYTIPAEAFENFKVKRGLRESDGTGVTAGITKVGLVHGYIINEGEREPVEGKLYYRCYDVIDLIDAYVKENRYGFDEISYILLFGELPTAEQLKNYARLIDKCRKLPDRFFEDVLMKAPSANVMNKMAASVLSLYSYDENPDDISLENVLRQSIFIIAALPIIAAQAYAVKRHIFDGESLNLHNPLPHLSAAQNFLRIISPDGSYSEDDAKLLDLCLVLHAEHGGGNNSTFACRVLSSSDTDTYSAVSAAIGSLKGPKHGGANAMVENMMTFIKGYVKNWGDKAELKECLLKIMKKELFDKSGLIYGIGHAVYTTSDPRAVLLKKYARKLAEKRNCADEFALIESVEELAPQVFAEHKKIYKPLCANVDLYSGLVYRMIGIPEELYTPLFVIARSAGWCAHRIEEILTGGRIIRPGYKTISTSKSSYIPLDARGEKK